MYPDSKNIHIITASQIAPRLLKWECGQAFNTLIYLDGLCQKVALEWSLTAAYLLVCINQLKAFFSQRVSTQSFGTNACKKMCGVSNLTQLAGHWQQLRTFLNWLQLMGYSWCLKYQRFLGPNYLNHIISSLCIIVIQV